METTTSTRKAAADLVDAMSKKLPLAIGEEFLANVREGLVRLPLSTMLSGTWTVRQQFSIIKEALKDLDKIEEIRDNLDPIPWRDLSFLLLNRLELVMTDRNSLENTATRLTEPSPAKIKVAANTKGPNIQRHGEASSGKIEPPTSKANPRPLKVPDISADKVAIIQQSLIKRVKDGAHPYDVRANRYVKCANKDCVFCNTMYHNLELTACAMFGHPPCIPEGYFPHVGISMWKTLRRQHDDGQTFKVRKDITRRPGDLPRLSEANPILTVCPPTSPQRKRASSVEPTVVAKSNRCTSVPPSWAEQAEAEFA